MAKIYLKREICTTGGNSCRLCFFNMGSRCANGKEPCFSKNGYYVQVAAPEEAENE